MPRLLLTPEANEMIRRAVLHNRNLEVGGFGHMAELTDDDDIIIDDIYVPPQIVQGAHTDIDVAGLDALMRHAATRDQTVGEWKLWWHSHSTMKAYASGTDEATLKAQARWLESWAIGLTVNVAGDHYCWLNIDSPFKLLMKELPTGIWVPPVNVTDLHAQVDEWMKEVKTSRYTPPTNSYNGNGGGFRQPGSAPPVAPTPPHATAPTLTPAQQEAAKKAAEETAAERQAAISLELGDWFVMTEPGMWVPRYQLPLSDNRYRPYSQYLNAKNFREQNGAPSHVNAPAAQAPMGGETRPPLPLPAKAGQTSQLKEVPVGDMDPEVQRIREKLLADRPDEPTPDSGPPSGPASGAKRGNRRGTKNAEKLGNVGDVRNVKVMDDDLPPDIDMGKPFILHEKDGGASLVMDGALIDLSQFHAWTDIPSTQMALALYELGWEPEDDERPPHDAPAGSLSVVASTVRNDDPPPHSVPDPDDYMYYMG